MYVNIFHIILIRYSQLFINFKFTFLKGVLIMKTKNLALTAIFAAITAILAQFVIPLPFTPVPFSMCVFGVYLTGAILSRSCSVYAQLIYLMLGVIGLPVFGGFSGGVGVIAGPTGGYILVYPLMAFIVSLMPHVFGKKSILSLAVGMVCALAVCYLGGSLWYCVVAKVTWAKSLIYTVLPFIPFDLIKIAVCAPFGFALSKALGKAKLLPAQQNK
jgi:biotin transport system substrate-specific component